MKEFPMRLGNMLPPIHPGEILREEFLVPLDMTPYALAKHLRVPRTRIERIVAEKIGISADTALRLGKFFNTTPQFWLNLQTGYDLKIAEAAIDTALDEITALEAAA
jgi:addiction module HigA family antidote